VLWRTCWGTHWELGEHIENLMGTHWELEGHIVETHWELGKNEKKILPCPIGEKKEKARHLECTFGPSCWLHEISLPKRFINIFGLG